jgi:hypothetical protein
MLRTLVSFLLGFATATCIALAVFPIYGREKYDHGREQGVITTKLDLLKQVGETFGDDYNKSDSYNIFFEVKADAAVVVERNGIKTLRIYVPGR